MSSSRYRILILGGGVAGLTTAIALSKCAPAHLLPEIDIFEIRSEPGTQGGAINLTPNALRLLDWLGVYKIIQERQYGVPVNAVEIFSVYHPHKLAESSFRGPHNLGIGSPPYKALRITRAALMSALLATLPSHPTITLHFGRRATSITSSPTPTTSAITITFSPPHPPATGTLLLGCDGVHSFTRNTYIDPTRPQTYTGVVNAFGFTPALSPAERAQTHFETSALNFSRRGLLLTSFHEPTRESGYVGAIIARPDAGSRAGWRAAGVDGEVVRRDMLERFVGGDGLERGESVLPSVRTFVQRAEEWWLWPVYMVPNGGRGRWARGRAMLLGDAAHGMPPQGESTGIVLEGVVLFARCLVGKMRVFEEMGRDGDGGDRAAVQDKVIAEAFEAYEKLRRPRIEAACTESMAVVHSVAETSRLGFWVKTCIIPIFLRLGKAKRQRHFEEDVTVSYLGFEDMAAASANKVVVARADEKSAARSLLSRLLVAWRQGGLWRVLRIAGWNKS